jgi:diguanylate cyclase (GGDEF)-like protein
MVQKCVGSAERSFVDKSVGSEGSLRVTPQTVERAVGTAQTQTELAKTAAALLDAVPDVIVVIGADMTLKYGNTAAREAFGGHGQDLDVSEIQPLDFIHPDDHLAVLEKLAEVVADTTQSKASLQFRVHHYEIGFGWKLVEANAVNHLDHPSINGLVISFRDLVREQLIATSAHRLGEALEQTSDGIVLHDADGNVLHANAVARAALGEAINQPGWPYPPELTELLTTFAIPQAKENGSYSTEIEVVDSNGAEIALSIIVSMHGDDSCVVTARDITHQKRFEADLEHRVSHDALTNLPNRVALVRKLRELTEPIINQRVAVLFLDLDRFKAVNDSLGHQFGDVLLVEVAGRLQSVIRNTSMLTRLGGDEFVVLLTDEAGIRPMHELASEVAARLHEVLTHPFSISGMPVRVSASIGISLQDGASNGVELLRQADLAMFQAKSTGRSRTVHFASSMALNAENSLAIEVELHSALTNGEIFVAYQPILSMVDGRVAGFEALVRWQRNGVVIEPAAFLDVAQQSDLITRIDSLVLSHACLQLAQWHRQFPAQTDLTVSVNLSARQLARPDLIDFVSSTIAMAGIPPHNVILEITEGTLMNDLGATMSALEGLRGIGVRLAIDDFGVGYSSLSYLQRFQAHIVKIDRRFVEHADRQTGDARIVEAIVSLAKTFGMATVAEGVETSSQYDRVRELGCDATQGYLTGRPMAVNAASAMLIAN